MCELNVTLNRSQASKASNLSGIHAFEFKVVRSAAGVRTLSCPHVLTDEEMTDVRSPTIDDAVWEFVERTARLAGLID